MNNNLIINPPAEHTLVRLNDCVWDGPDFLTGNLSPLKTAYGTHENTIHLFVNISKINDANWHHILMQLRCWKTQGSQGKTLDNAALYKDAYKWLSDMISNDSEQALR